MGWDCHGLPLENPLIEKKLGLATKRDIEDYGVKNFNEAAREAVLEYRDDWKWQIPRLGRWADMTTTTARDGRYLYRKCVVGF